MFVSHRSAPGVSGFGNRQGPGGSGAERFPGLRGLAAFGARPCRPGLLKLRILPEKDHSSSEGSGGEYFGSKGKVSGVQQLMASSSEDPASARHGILPKS